MVQRGQHDDPGRAGCADRARVVPPRPASRPTTLGHRRVPTHAPRRRRIAHNRELADRAAPAATCGSHPRGVITPGPCPKRPGRRDRSCRELAGRDPAEVLAHTASGRAVRTSRCGMMVNLAGGTQNIQEQLADHLNSVSCISPRTTGSVVAHLAEDGRVHAVRLGGAPP